MAFYRRKLPHWQPNYAEFFITLRLANSLPKAAVKRIQTEKEILEQEIGEARMSDKLSDLHNRQKLILHMYEKLLDKADTGPTWLSKNSVAQIICEALHHRDRNIYELYAYCVMPNHVHVVFKMLKKNTPNIPAVTRTLQSFKSFTALKANRVLNRTGQFWQHESFDRVIRNQDELDSTIKYILNNPVKAGLVPKWQDWPYNFCKSEFKIDFM